MHLHGKSNGKKHWGKWHNIKGNKKSLADAGLEPATSQSISALPTELTTPYFMWPFLCNVKPLCLDGDQSVSTPYADINQGSFPGWYILIFYINIVSSLTLITYIWIHIIFIYKLLKWAKKIWLMPTLNPRRPLTYHMILYSYMYKYLHHTRMLHNQSTIRSEVLWHQFKDPKKTSIKTDGLVCWPTNKWQWP